MSEEKTKIILGEAEENRRLYDYSVTRRDEDLGKAEHARDIQQSFVESRDFHDALGNSGRATVAEAHMAKHGWIAEGAIRMANDAEETRGHRNEEALHHLKSNREVYEQEAIKGANAAGRDINFGGKHYPAQLPEQP
ncbi:MAG TPA: hypothetical protein PKB09_00550 [Candidatus Saccharibacteria bacterium]|nr:hypothetical protein [Candidatus Saccharibacteria bacterium]